MANEQSNNSNDSPRQAEEDFDRNDAQFIASGKITTANAMATCFAHQINNPLEVIQAVIYRLLKKPQVSEAEEIRDGLLKIQQNANRINDLIQHLYKLIKDEPGDFEYIEVSKVIRSAFKLFEQQLHNRRIKVDLSKIDEANSSVVVYGNSVELEQVLINLIANARDALASVEPADTAQITVAVQSNSQDVVILFSDNGEGITEENQHRIFDSLFTTKPKGTGLGLWLCYSVIHQMKGTIKVESTVGQGTTFTITLPNRGNKYGKA